MGSGEAEPLLRVYDTGTAIARNDPEDPICCIEEVNDSGGWHSYQCTRKRGYGPKGEYCKQHARMVERTTNHALSGRELTTLNNISARIDRKP